MGRFDIKGKPSHIVIWCLKNEETFKKPAGDAVHFRLEESMGQSYGYVEVHGSGMVIKTSQAFSDRAEAVAEANRSYNRAVNTRCADGVRFGIMDGHSNVKGRLFMTKNWKRHPGGPFK